MDHEVRNRRLGSMANCRNLSLVLSKRIADEEQILKSQTEEAYDVIKPSFLRKNRTIVLSYDGFTVIRSDQLPQKFYQYDDIISVNLKGTNTVAFIIKPDGKELVFESKEASKIASSSRLRRHKFLNLQKIRMSLNMSLLFYSKMNEPVPQVNKPQKWKLSLPQQLAEKRNSKLINKSPIPENIVNISKSNFLSEDQCSLLESYVNPIIFSKKEYEEARTVKLFMDTLDSTDKTPEKLSEKTRNLIDALKDRITYAYRGLILSEMDVEISLDVFAKQVEKILQKLIITRIYKKLMNYFTKKHESNNLLIDQNRKYMRELDQISVGIEEKYVSKSNWSLAIIEFNNMINYQLPYEKMECILSTLRAIVDTTKIEGSFDTFSGISADDLLPILIYVISHSDICELESLSQYLWLLSDPNELSGESGYYLTVFTSVVEFLKNYNNN